MRSNTANEFTPNQFGGHAYLWTVPLSAAGFMASTGSYVQCIMQ